MQSQKKKKERKEAIRISFQRCHRCPVRACAAAGGSEKRRSAAASPGRRRTPTGGASAPGPPLSSKLQRLPTGSAGGTPSRDPPYAASLFQIASHRLEADAPRRGADPIFCGAAAPILRRAARPPPTSRTARSCHPPEHSSGTARRHPSPCPAPGRRHYSNPRPRRRLRTPLASQLAVPAGGSVHGRCRPPRLTPPGAALWPAARRLSGSRPAAFRGDGRRGTAGSRGSRGVA